MGKPAVTIDNDQNKITHLQFTENGIKFPVALINKLLAGEVAFVCGAGVSMPPLPSFGKLADELFKQARVTPGKLEKLLMKQGNYEEALEALKKRLSNTEFLHQKLAENFADKLKKPRKIDLSRHETIIRLARGVNNNLQIVTTNFDCLFERAYQNYWKKSPEDISYTAKNAGFKPGDADFDCIVHLHGRIEDDELKLPTADIVLTSFNYGEAYMQDGFALRFISQLLMSYTVVFIGYSAGDVVMRYFLSSLAQDRKRLPFLPKSYAFCTIDDVEKWQHLNCETISYEVKGRNNHDQLWNELSSLADILDNPNTYIQTVADSVLRLPTNHAPQFKLDQLLWAFQGRKYSFGHLPILKDMDVSWFDYFSENSFYNDEEISLKLLYWYTQQSDSREIFDIITARFNKFGHEFIDAFFRDPEFLQSLRRKNPLWVKAWNLLSYCEPEKSFSPDLLTFKPICIDLTSYTSIQKMMAYMTPKLVVNLWNDYSSYVNFNKNLHTDDEKLSNIATFTLKLKTQQIDVNIQDIYGLMKEINQIPNSSMVLEIASQCLQEIIYLGIEAEIINRDFDHYSYSGNIPSISGHEQNNYHMELSPLLPLITILSYHFEKLVQENPDHAKRVSERWKNIPCLIGLRLWLYAHKFSNIFTANEAMSELINLSAEQITILAKKEVFDILENRLSEEIDQGLLLALEQKIIDSAKELADE